MTVSILFHGESIVSAVLIHYAVTAYGLTVMETFPLVESLTPRTK